LTIFIVARLHTFPFLILNFVVALKLSYAIVVCGLIAPPSFAITSWAASSPTPLSKSSSAAASYLQIGVCLGRIGAG
jgi:hypothetical protein